MAQTPPGALGWPFLGDALTFLKDPFAYTLERTRTHGPVWKTRILGDTVVFFAGSKAFSFFMDPEHFTREAASPKFMQELLHPDAVPFLDGERHRTRKRLLLTAFRDESLATYLPTIFTILERFASKWVAEGEQRLVGDLSQAGFDIADALFAAADPKVSNVEGAKDFSTMNRGTFAPPVNLPFTAYGRAIKARDRLRRYLGRQVAERGGEGTALGVLKLARGPNGEALSAAELEIELLHFFFAAHGGLTAALAWLLTILGSHPEIAAKVRAEADQRLTESVPTLEQTRELAYARALSREVLRAFPIVPVTFFGIAKRDLEFEAMSIRAGWKGAGAVWATLQDGSTFADPVTFKAERLSDAATHGLPPNAFVPQGGGHQQGHRCAGEALIQLVMPAFLGWFARHYDFALPQQDTRPGGGGLAPLPKDGLRARVSLRKT